MHNNYTNLSSRYYRALNNSSVDVESLTHAISDEEIDNTRRELYKQAIDDARSKAEEIASYEAQELER